MDAPSALVGYVGRLDEPVKGVAVLLMAMARLHTLGGGPRLAVVGEGRSGAGLRGALNRLGLEGQVSFLGLRHDIPRLMRAMDVLALPSLQEGSPNVILEGMAAGVVVLATDVGGIPELIRHGETGWLVPPGDPDAMATGIRFLLDNPQLAASMAASARVWVESHRAIDQTVDAFLTLYSHLRNDVSDRRERAFLAALLSVVARSHQANRDAKPGHPEPRGAGSPGESDGGRGRRMSGAGCVGRIPRKRSLMHEAVDRRATRGMK